MRFTVTVRRVVGVAALLLAGGCGGGTPSISGKITYRGQPIPFGRVTFVGADGNACDSLLGADGSFSISPARAGPMKVVVTGGAAPVPQAKKGAPKPPQAIPAKYGHKDTTDLTADIHAGANEFNYDIP